MAAAAEIEGEGDDRGDGPRGPAHDVRYQYYAAADGLVLLMATERRFWQNFCRAIDRSDLFERWPGEGYADHDYANEALRDELASIFATRTRAEWVRLFLEHDVAGSPVYEADEVVRDPHLAARALWTESETHRMRIPGSPLRIDGARSVASSRAPTHGEQSEAILRRVLNYDDEAIATLRSQGVLGKTK